MRSIFESSYNFIAKDDYFPLSNTLKLIMAIGFGMHFSIRESYLEAKSSQFSSSTVFILFPIELYFLLAKVA